MWAIVFGVVGGRLYHVVSDPELYFTAGRNPWNAFKIWDGCLGIWGRSPWVGWAPGSAAADTTSGWM